MKKILIIPTILTIMGLTITGCSNTTDNDTKKDTTDAAISYETDGLQSDNNASMQSNESEEIITIEGTPEETSEITNNLILSDEAVIIDIRTPEEFEKSHLEGAVNEDFYGDFLEEMNKKYDKDAHIVIYCRSGNRSEQALELLREDGFLNIIDLGAMEDAATITNIEIVK